MTHTLKLNTVPLARSTAIPAGLVRIYQHNMAPNFKVVFDTSL